VRTTTDFLLDVLFTIIASSASSSTTLLPHHTILVNEESRDVTLNRDALFAAVLWPSPAGMNANSKQTSTNKSLVYLRETLIALES